MRVEIMGPGKYENVGKSQSVWIRVRVDIMGAGKYENVRKSQSVLGMIDPMIFTRTRINTAGSRWGMESTAPQSDLRLAITAGLAHHQALLAAALCSLISCPT